MSKKLRIGVIGCGGIATWAHMPAYENMDNVEIVAMCDIKIEKAKALAEKHGVEKVFEDYHDVIALPEVDAIDICTPNKFHSIIAVDALNAGKHVFSEKPDAVSVEEALKMKEASEKNNKTLMVMRNNRHSAPSKFLKKYIEEGNMGEIYAGRCGWQRTRGIPGKGGWFTTKELSGGGPLIDLGVHMIDLSIWLMGNPTPIAVSGSTYTKFADTKISTSRHARYGEADGEGTFDVEDLAMGFIKFDNGACLQIEFSWASNIDREKRYVELRGTKSGSTWINEEVELYGEQSGAYCVTTPQIKKDIGGHEANLRHFIDVVLNGAKPDFEPIQGVNMIKILQAIYKSAETGKEIEL